MSYAGPSQSEITRLRLLVGESSFESSWSSETLSDIIEQHGGDLYAAAADVWKFKAAEIAGNPTKWSADGGTYDFTGAHDYCIAEAARCQAMSASAGGMIIDPTLKPVEVE